MKDQIFISYRRDDSAGTSGRLKDYLDDAFGADHVFKDVDDIPAGADFRKVIGKELMDSSVVLIIIGKQYLKLKGADGNVRIFSEDDYVNIEVSTALAFRNQKMVVPVLVDGANMPGHSQLPDNLKELAFLNAVSISHHNWKGSVQKLISEIQKHRGELEEEPSHTETKQNKQQGSTITKTQAAYLAAKAKKSKSAPAPKRNTLATVLSVFGGLFLLMIVVAIAIPSFLDEETVVTEPVGVYNNVVNFSSFNGYVDATQLNVRDQPGTEGTNVEFKLSQGDEVEVIAKRELPDKDWYRIKFGDERGWVSSDYISQQPIGGINPSVQTKNQKTGSQYNQQVVEDVYEPAPVNNNGSTYQSQIIGTWELIGLESNGNYMTLNEALTLQAGEPVNARETYTLDGTIIRTTSYINGVSVPNQPANYYISGNRMTTTLGFAGVIEHLDYNSLKMSSTTTDYYSGTTEILMHYQRIQ